MQNLIVVGVIAISFFTVVRYLSHRYYRAQGIRTPSIVIFPISRDDALLFAGQLGGVIEIIFGYIFSYTELAQISTVSIWILGFMTQFLCYVPFLIAVPLAILVAKIKNL